MPAEGPVDALVRRLVETATREEGQEADRFLALRQLGQVGKGRRISGGLLIPLLRYASPREPGGVLLDAYESVPAARALATGGPETDGIVYEQLLIALKQGKERIPFLCLALALAEGPEPSVTRRLAVLAASLESGEVGRRFLALALAARKDETRDWTSEIASNLKETVLKADQKDAQMLLALMTALAYAAPRLEATEPLANAAWGILEAAGPDELPFLPLVCYGLLERKAMSAHRAAAIRERVARMPSRGRSELPSVAAAMLAMAATGIDPEGNFEEAVRLMSFRAFSTGDWYVLQFIVDSMVEPRFLPSLARLLTSRSGEVKEGALRMAEMMGPYAHLLLPEVQKLEGDPVLATQARRVARTIRGFDEWGPRGSTEPQSGGN